MAQPAGRLPATTNDQQVEVAEHGGEEGPDPRRRRAGSLWR